MTLQYTYAYGPKAILGEGAFSYERGTPVTPNLAWSGASPLSTWREAIVFVNLILRGGLAFRVYLRAKSMSLKYTASFEKQRFVLVERLRILLG